ncbi:MAG TPA: aspartate aminotransferase family protein [Solirubrobacteraceae bacterium]
MALSPDQLATAAHDHLLLQFSRNGAYGPDGSDLVVLERGEGPYVWDTRGQRYIDGLSCLFCCQLGYSYGHEMAEVAAAQLARLPFNTNWGTAHPPAIELAARLGELAPGDLNRVMFTSGGSESVEAAWKLARLHHVANGEPQRIKAIARDRAYHGVTLGALALTGVASNKEPFGEPAIPVARISHTGRFRVADGDDEAAFCARLLDELERTIQSEGPEQIALIIAEPVQNAGGCLEPPAGYWQGLRALADRYGILLCADEVITGFGRLGEWFASSRYGAEPDLLTVAKGLTSAHAAMGAVLVSDRVAEPLYEPGRMLVHGITFAGHPVSAAIALRNLEIFERDGVLENVRALEDHLRSRMQELTSLPIVADVRGAGFFWAAELVKGDRDSRFDAAERERLIRGLLPRELVQAGLIARADDRGEPVLQIAPPLICDAAQLDEIVDAMATVLAAAGEEMVPATPVTPAATAGQAG